MAWLHAWSGLVVGWILFAVFVTGTASYYRAEISQWMRPELRYGRTFGPDEMAATAERGVAYLREHAGGARTWFITLPRPEMPLLDCSGGRDPAVRRATSCSIPTAGRPPKSARPGAATFSTASTSN